MNDIVDVAIVGAGPYGLSLAAHLRNAGVGFRQFGYPMSLWRTAMPKGMFLKSQGFASNLSDPRGTHTLEEFCRATGRTYGPYGVPVSLETFLAYGQWFQQHHAPDVEETFVTDLTRDDGMFAFTLANGDQGRARRVVVAAGVEHFSRMPNEIAGLPREVCSHASEHMDLGVFNGKRVIVLGAGQSALETAALLHESGAAVQLLARRRQVEWNGLPLSPDRPLLRRIREPEAGLGSGLSTWLYSECPRWFRRLPEATRIYRSRTALGPAGAWWLRKRVEGQFPLLVGRHLQWAEASTGEARLGVRDSSGRSCELAADHVICATGYRPDIRRLPFLSDSLRTGLTTIDGGPRVGGDFQSPIPGLYFMGPAVVATFGPVMRFVYGADFAARVVARELAKTSVSEPVMVQGAAR